MGGFGSGRQWGYGTRPLVESQRWIRVNDLRRLLRPGELFPTVEAIWGDGTKMTIQGTGDRMYLVFGNGATFSVGVAWVRTPFGGRRAWFRCPCCGHRTETLYVRETLACRRCFGLAYAVENADRIGRAWRKRRGLWRKLGAQDGTGNFFPARPRYMHWQRYLRAMERDVKIERQLGAASSLILGRLLQRLGE